MERIITYENLKNFAYVNDDICQKPYKGIVLFFSGLGGAEFYPNIHPITLGDAKLYAEKGILYVFPYNNPWSWMNRQAVAYTDELIDVLIAHYNLPSDIPIVSTGGSMGGLAALVYTAFAARTPVACVANCPVCDLPYHYTERPDLPRTLYSAFYHVDGTLDEALKTASPLHMVDQMPDVDYYIFHCESDQAVNIERHSNVFVEEMAKSHRVIYHTVPGQPHCKLTDEMRQLYIRYIENSIL